MSVLSNAPVADGTTAPLALAAEIQTPTASALIEAHGDELSQQDVVRAALALEQNGKRDEAMELLQRYRTPLHARALARLLLPTGPRGPTLLSRIFRPR